MDKKLMLSQIKKHYNFKNNTEFANYLGISPQVLSNWKSRNTYNPELIYMKCLKINSKWLLTGKGSMLREPEVPTKEVSPKKENTTTLTENNIKEKLIILQEETIAKQKKRITDLEKLICELRKKNKSLKQLKIKNSSKKKHASGI